MWSLWKEQRDLDCATWYDADGFIVGTGDGIDGLDASSFSVLVTDSIGCSAEVTDINVLTGLQDIDEMTWAVYPNPAHDVLTLHGLPLGASWALINTQGQTMATGQGLRRGKFRCRMWPPACTSCR